METSLRVCAFLRMLFIFGFHKVILPEKLEISSVFKSQLTNI